MRAILIDPERQTLTEIDFKGTGDSRQQEISDLIGCQLCGFGACLSDGDRILVSDDGYEGRDVTRFWFQVDADRVPPTSHPIAGKGLAVGIDPKGGKFGKPYCDLRIYLSDLAKRITFTKRRFKRFERTPYGIKVVAPIIEEG
jgi:hypothetical protein